MTPERWQKAKQIFHAALDREPAERPAFLAETCGADELLRQEVELLISSHEKDGSFIDSPAYEAASELLVDDKRELQPGQTIASYEIISFISRGGMGEVYLAKDQRLDRRVAIKILNEEFGRSESNRNRFIQEAKAASSLNHPNILVIHEIDESAHYLISEFIEGKTLRAVLCEQALPLTKSLDIAIQIASALVAAHAVHLVHRDIKPDNVMLRPDGLVKVLDFGLAKLVEKDKSIIGTEDSTVARNLTAKGMILGTVNYMSPEQAKGEVVDERTDIFSFGALIYELITQKPPFAGDSVSESLANLINQEPQPLSRFAVFVPTELQRIVSKTLQKKKDHRYQTMPDVLTDLKSLRRALAFDEKLERSQPSNEKGSAVLRATSGSTNLQAAETQKTYAQKIKRNALLFFLSLGMLSGLIAFGTWYFGNRSGKQIGSIAVMPFLNESGNADVEYLADGMTETLISTLSQLPNLDVKARSSVFRYKGKDTNANTIASELNVQSFFNGKLRQHGNDLSLYVELVDARTERVLWSQTYNRPLT